MSCPAKLKTVPHDTLIVDLPPVFYVTNKHDQCDGPYIKVYKNGQPAVISLAYQFEGNLHHICKADETLSECAAHYTS